VCAVCALLTGSVNSHGASDSSVNDGETCEGYMYKWPWVDQHAYNSLSSASGIEGE